MTRVTDVQFGTNLSQDRFDGRVYINALQNMNWRYNAESLSDGRWERFRSGGLYSIQQECKVGAVFYNAHNMLRPHIIKARYYEIL